MVEIVAATNSKKKCVRDDIIVPKAHNTDISGVKAVEAQTLFELILLLYFPNGTNRGKLRISFLIRGKRLLCRLKKLPKNPLI